MELLEKIRKYLTEEEYRLGRYLEEIKKDETKVVSCNWFDSDQWIEYGPKGYVYEDGAFIGYTSVDVIYFFQGLYQLQWSKTAKWFIKDKPDPKPVDIKKKF